MAIPALLTSTCSAPSLRLNIGNDILPDAFLGDILFAGARRAARFGDKGNGFFQTFASISRGDDAGTGLGQFLRARAPYTGCRAGNQRDFTATIIQQCHLASRGK